MITTEQVTEALDAVIAEVGEDYVYPQQICKYVVRDAAGNPAPSCIAGRVLHRLGADLDSLSRAEGLSVDALHGADLPDLDIDGEGLKALRQAQVIQDGDFGGLEGRGTWGQARQAYRDYLDGKGTVAEQRYQAVL